MKVKSKNPIKGIRLRTINIGMISISCILYILLIWATIHAWQKYEHLVSSTDEYIQCEKNAALVADGSNYLTEQVRLYTVTLDEQYVQNYFTEVYETRRRDSVLEHLESYETGQKTSGFLLSALEYSNQLMEKEIYSMKLIAFSQKQDLKEFPDIQEVSLKPEDEALKPEEMIEKARELVFSSDYQNSKELIVSNISSFLAEIIKDTQQKQFESSMDLKGMMRKQQFLISILFIENLLVFILIIQLIIKPLQIYVKNIQNETMLEITGSYEFKYLALTYNNIFELNAANETTLRHQAEHDPLTGIINRGAFDQLKQFLKAKLDPIALLIIDVDKFKLVNDGYGHETGDKVLQKVARLLEESFRSTDFPARIGGDEFAVIITDITEDLKSVIETKINAINEALLHPDDGLPEVSLSVGAAFSESGFSDDLYGHADEALYDVKKHGRCGLRFYQKKEQEE